MNRQVMLGLGLTLTLVGCTGQHEVRHDTYTIYVHGRSLFPASGEDSLIEGTLAVQNGCVLLEQEEFDIVYPVVWPSGTRITSEDPLTLELPSGEELEVGQDTSGDGGYHSASSDRVSVEIPPECVPQTDEVAIFNRESDPAVSGGDAE